MSVSQSRTAGAGLLLVLVAARMSPAAMCQEARKGRGDHGSTQVASHVLPSLWRVTREGTAKHPAHLHALLVRKVQEEGLQGAQLVHAAACLLVGGSLLGVHHACGGRVKGGVKCGRGAVRALVGPETHDGWASGAGGTRKMGSWRRLAGTRGMSAAHRHRSQRASPCMAVGVGRRRACPGGARHPRKPSLGPCSRRGHTTRCPGVCLVTRLRTQDQPTHR